MPGARMDRTPGCALLIIALVVLLNFGRRFAAWILDFQWWQEIGQKETLFSLIYYSVTPVLIVTVIAFVAFWTAHARGMKAAGSGLGEHPLYSKAATLGALIVAYLFASGSVSSWTAVLFLGGRQLPAEATKWTDPVFGHALSFYMFELPFYEMLLGILLGVTVITGLIYAGTQLFWTAKIRGPRVHEDGTMEWSDFDLSGIIHSHFWRWVVVVFLLVFAASRYLDRYDLLTQDHGFMVGVDYVDEHVRLPMRWLSIGGCLVAIAAMFMRRWMITVGLVVLPLVLEAVVPQIVHSLYVRPNEISLEKPYIHRHIEATRTAYGLDKRTREVEHKAKLDARIDPNKHRPMLDNVRLWDWRAFHDTVTQIQALRPYYVFHDTDVDRYNINGELRQVMLTPRELDVQQLAADARSRWMNPHFSYTHGFGLVLAEANRITQDGLPLLFIQNAPPEVKTSSLKLTRPELYYGEVTHEPVFVRTGQPEFNYPSGAENATTRYEGKGGFPIASFPMRLAATVAYTDWNILLTGFFTNESRMMIHRNVRQRVSELADFISWDTDPYLVITKEGRLVWMIDGYTTSKAHPYSKRVRTPSETVANYMRNSVKATVDAYDGDIRLYIFDETDPIIDAYARLFPKLFRKRAEMPADLQEHVRYPEGLFRVQAEIYRNFHMKDSEAFYNKEDSWDIAKVQDSQEGRAAGGSAPNYVVTTLPGESKPEFLLMIPFTPRGKDNLIGIMVARCDGEHLGELVFLQLSKQELIFGPMQIAARINQDGNISKDLTLWNQQGSRVVMGQMLVLPVEETFLYVQPIYIQSNQARMPQLKRVALAVGNQLVYAETYEQAVAQLAGLPPAAVRETSTASPPKEGPAPVEPPPSADAEKRISEVRRHLQRYRELTAQGKYVEAAKELEALETVTRPAVRGR
ncbi:MAG: UPF0182 family protein [Acidobacteria bacterium]|nr:UPF0182 family protein [Acidobacteriota bacterium]